MSIYRKIWTKQFGPIPKDEAGRSYEIHHIDGNRNNNDISNLMCVSIQEHYDIHYAQGDYGACFKMMPRLVMSGSQISEISKELNAKRIENGTHNWLGGEYQKKLAKSRIENGTHPWLGGEHQRKQVENGTHPFLGGEIQKRTQRERVLSGKHHFLGGEIQRKRVKEGTHHLQNRPIVQCPHCDKSGDSSNMKRWHFDNCKNKPR